MFDLLLCAHTFAYVKQFSAYFQNITLPTPSLLLCFLILEFVNNLKKSGYANI